MKINLKSVKFLAVGLICFASFSSVAAQDFQKVKDATDITWYGIDLTKAKLVGTPIDFKNLNAIVKTHFASWNHLFLSEPAKYDLAGATGKKISFETKTALEQNALVDTVTLISTERNQLTEADIKDAVKKYKADASGVGMAMVVENFDKPLGTLRLYVVFFDPSNGSVFTFKKYENRVGGAGFRNYWASGFYKSILQLKSDFPKLGE